MPALLTATFAAFAIVLGLFTIARGEEQSARSDTAADAAALAAAKQWHTEALTALRSTAQTPAIGLVTLPLLNAFQPTRGVLRAQEYADANGGALRRYRWLGDLSPLTWTVEVQVEQSDDMPHGADEARSTSRARVEATGGICNAGGVVGLVLRTGTCAGPARAAKVCTPPTPADPNPLFVDCPSAAEIAARFATERVFVDWPR